MTRKLTLALLVIAACGGSKPAPTAPAAKPSGAPAATTYSTGEQVLEASIAAQGGRDKLAKLTAIKQVGTLAISQMGMKGTLTTFGAPPRSTLAVIDLPGLGKIMQGTLGDLAWELNPVTGARIITGAEKLSTMREGTFNADLVWKDLYPKAELAGLVDWNGAKAYKVVLTAAEGDTVTRYFAPDTLLLRGFEMVVKSQMGEIPVTLLVSEYREVDGLKFPSRMQRKDATTSLEITIDAIELSPAIPAATFEPPSEIQALLRK
jgi:zinc protease